MMSEDFAGLPTESTNPATADLDRLSTLELVQRMNAEDSGVALSVQAVLPAIAAAIDAIAGRMRQGGRLIYMGAGTSGRLGVLDAAECPPTFGVAPDRVIGLLAGGQEAFQRPDEGAEDNPGLGEEDLRRIELDAADSVVGVAASGRTPYVLGGLSFARRLGCLTVAVACNLPAAVSQVAEISILAPVGAEVLSGSTRLKAGTAQKMILNMLSTGVMVRLGKTYGNLMVDVKPTNQKLRARALRILQQAAGIEEVKAEELLAACGGEVKTAIVAARLNCGAPEARLALERAGGMVRQALGEND
jgi:N-acetylmuramic acid 6-phosphate etherase